MGPINFSVVLMVDSITINLVQDRFLVGDIKANARKIITLSEQARQSGADIVVFPELALSGYPPEDLLLRQGFIRQIDTAIQQIVSQVAGIDIVFGAPRHDGDDLFNSAFWARDGQILDVYDKYTLPNYAVFDEKRYFAVGQRPVVVELNGIKLGLSICEDIWFERAAADAAQAGAQGLLILNASPFHQHKHDQRVQVLKQRQAETGMAMFYLNLVGGQDELVFDGQSLVLDSSDELVGRGPAFEATQLQYRFSKQGDIESIDTVFHQLDSNEAVIYKGLVMAVRDYVSNNGFDGVVIGLSGGVDSALTLAIAVDALGAEQVHAVMMPLRHNLLLKLRSL